MTDWERVERLRGKGRSWSDIAKDAKVGFQAPAGSDPGKALKVLYLRHRGAASSPSAQRRQGASKDLPRSQPYLQGILRRARTRSGMIAGGMAIVVVVGVMVWVVTLPPPSAATQLVTYCGGEGSVAHYHPLLVINVDGTQEHLPYDASQPADIGYLDSPGFTNSSLSCPNGGIHALHTHDGSGIIHVELPSNLAGLTPTLGEFFQIWGEPLSSHQVWTFTGTVQATVRNVETSVVSSYSSDPGSIPLAAASCGPTCNPASIPNSLIFNGAYGGGESGGLFSGEIIWLNVTTTGAAAAGGAMAGALGCACGAAMLCAAPNRATVRGSYCEPIPMDRGGISTILGGDRTGASGSVLISDPRHDDTIDVTQVAGPVMEIASRASSKSEGSLEWGSVPGENAGPAV